MKYTLYIASAIVGVFSLATVVLAANPFDIEYPIDSLGGCGSQQECKTYCDDPVNEDSCIAFAEEKDLIPKEKIERIKEKRQEFKENFETGPGGCSSPRECDNFCRVEENLETCTFYDPIHFREQL